MTLGHFAYTQFLFPKGLVFLFVCFLPSYILLSPDCGLQNHLLNAVRYTDALDGGEVKPAVPGLCATREKLNLSFSTGEIREILFLSTYDSYES